ncbi:MAG TPA: asparagine synthase-related protein [Candidatus Hydrogenedentes bacterium]|nr:asparagine synthase-related protein [Candidatus Hydrogenedentota bacterium]
MGALCGMLGRSDRETVRAMARALGHRGECARMIESDHFVVAGTDVYADGLALVDGQPRDKKGAALDPAGLWRQVLAAQRPDELHLLGAFAAVVQIPHPKAHASAPAVLDLGYSVRTWWLLRDRLGIKPLYYAMDGKALLFASELKALLAPGVISKRLNLASVDRYLTLRCVPGPETIIQGVYRVKPGHVLVFQDGHVKETPFSAFAAEIVAIDRGEAAREVCERLREAVAGADTDAMLWSAGIDCASLAAVHPGRPRPLFVSLKGTWQDELWRAKESARLLGLDLHVARGRSLTESVMGRVAYHLDEPIADPSVFPLWMIAEQAGKMAPVWASGHGADEMLGGYPRYHFMQKARSAERLIPMDLLQGMAPVLPPNAFVRRSERYLRSLSDSLEMYFAAVAVFDHAERNALYTDAMQAAIHEKGGSASALRPLFQGKSLSRDILSLNLNVALPDLLLAKCDRIFAAHGATLAYPYLNDAFVDFAITVPPEVKFGVRSKPLLRQAMKGLLPGRIRMRARRDFKMPQSGPAYRVIDEAARAIVTSERVETTGLFRWPYVEQIMRMATHNVYARRQFWALLMLFVWHREFME